MSNPITTELIRNENKSTAYPKGYPIPNINTRYQGTAPFFAASKWPSTEFPKTPPCPICLYIIILPQTFFPTFVHHNTRHHVASFASMILFPPMVLTLLTNSPLTSSASTSSPPPMLLPLISTLGTVRRPVLFSSADCRPAPSGCWSNSTT